MFLWACFYSSAKFSKLFPLVSSFFAKNKCVWIYEWFNSINVILKRITLWMTYLELWHIFVMLNIDISLNIRSINTVDAFYLCNHLAQIYSMLTSIKFIRSFIREGTYVNLLRCQRSLKNVNQRIWKGIKVS